MLRAIRCIPCPGQIECAILLIFLLGEAIDGAFMANTALIDEICPVADVSGKIKVLFGQ